MKSLHTRQQLCWGQREAVVQRLLLAVQRLGNDFFLHNVLQEPPGGNPGAFCRYATRLDVRRSEYICSAVCHDYGSFLNIFFRAGHRALKMEFYNSWRTVPSCQQHTKFNLSASLFRISSMTNYNLLKFGTMNMQLSSCCCKQEPLLSNTCSIN